MTEDRWPVRVVVGTLAAAVMLCLVAEAVLAFTHTPIPDQLDRLGSIAIGAIAGILSRTSRPDPTEAQAVTIDTTETGPVPVDADPVNLDPGPDDENADVMPKPRRRRGGTGSTGP